MPVGDACECITESIWETTTIRLDIWVYLWDLLMELLNFFEAGSLGTKFLKKLPTMWSSKYHSLSVSY